MQDLLPALQPLRARFVELSLSRSIELSRLRSRILLGQEPLVAMREIGEVVHKISGVAATLGFPAWGQLAAEIDLIINRLRKQEISLEVAFRSAEPMLDALIRAMSAISNQTVNRSAGS